MPHPQGWKSYKMPGKCSGNEGDGGQGDAWLGMELIEPLYKLGNCGATYYYTVQGHFQSLMSVDILLLVWLSSGSKNKE